MPSRRSTASSFCPPRLKPCAHRRGVDAKRTGRLTTHSQSHPTIRSGQSFACSYAPIVQRAAAIIGSAIFLVIAPGTLAVYVPWYLTHWHFAPPLFPIARVLGAALIVAGLPVLLDSFARFALQGLGTPAPVMPPKRLVVTGFYRYVRNPMYVAVTALIAGQGLLFGSVTVLEYGAILWAGFFLFVVAYEEPALSEQFADEYKRYRANVRRWLPRITPWRG
jgi:protein-S-isoprenylcysteine O-methyltransferase Ste14